MRIALSVFLVVCCLPALGQTPASAPAAAQPPKAAAAATAPAAHATAQPPKVEDSEIGFSYKLPADWEFVVPPPAPEQTVPFPGVVATKKGDACAQVVLAARRGAPVSSVVVSETPFSCYGETVTPADLRDFARGAVEGLSQAFKVTELVQGSYRLGSHALWIERAKGEPKAHPADSYTFETACAILIRGAVCWTALAADAASLQAFERAPVSLEGERFPALVPANAFVSSP